MFGDNVNMQERREKEEQEFNDLVGSKGAIDHTGIKLMVGDKEIKGFSRANLSLPKIHFIEEFRLLNGLSEYEICTLIGLSQCLYPDLINFDCNFVQKYGIDYHNRIVSNFNVLQNTRTGQTGINIDTLNKLKEIRKQNGVKVG